MQEGKPMASKRRVTTDQVPEPPHGLFSNAFAIGETVYLSGQHAGAPGGGLIGDAGVASQMRESLNKIKALVEAAGGRMSDIVKLTIYVTDISKRAEISAVRREFFSGDMPCSTLLGITALSAPDLVVEVDAMAVIGSGV
jgi:enamine deaminase RidA (YjgF/YER057c/UK114 family)